MLLNKTVLKGSFNNGCASISYREIMVRKRAGEQQPIPSERRATDLDRRIFPSSPVELFFF
jgi:hypothetical protein